MRDYLTACQDQRARAVLAALIGPTHSKRPPKLGPWLLLVVLLGSASLSKGQASLPEGATLPESAAAPNQELAKIEGSVRAASSRGALPEATILLTGTSFSTNTKADGSFQLLVPEEQLKAGYFTLLITAVGYKRQEVKVLLVAGIPRIDVALRRKW